MDEEARQEAIESLRSITDDIREIVEARPGDDASDEEVARFNEEFSVSSMIAKALVHTALLASVLIEVLEDDVTG